MARGERGEEGKHQLCMAENMKIWITVSAHVWLCKCIEERRVRMLVFSARGELRKLYRLID